MRTVSKSGWAFDIAGKPGSLWHLTYQAAVLFEQSSRAEAQRKLQLWKSKLISLPPDHEIHQCPECGRAVFSRIEWSSHSSTLHQFFLFVISLAIVDSN